MDETASRWTRAIDSYCERTGPELWSEPINAVTNAAFLIAAWLAWRAAEDAGRADDWAVRALTVILTAIGIGSFLFHTFANGWSVLMDVIPIMLFILVYLHLILVRYYRLPAWAGLIAVVAYLPVSGAVGGALSAVVGSLNGSMGYVPTLLFMAAFGWDLRRRGHPAAEGLLVASALLAASLIFRTLDAQEGAVCAALPLGTHWLWHVLNGTLLGWLIVTLVRHGRPLASEARAG